MPPRNKPAPRPTKSALEAKRNRISAGDINRLLHARYDADYFTTTEFQVGGKRGGRGEGSGGRIDYLAIKPSWSHSDVEAIEIKVSRADFVGDNKWPQYLPYATRFWFATAAGICTRDEIPEQAGWLEASANGARLYVRKKAPNQPPLLDGREAELMRAVIHRHFYGRHRDPEMSRAERVRVWKEWVDDRSAAKAIGKAARNQVQQIVRAAKNEAKEARELLAGVDAIRAALRERGVQDHAIIGAGTEQGSRYKTGDTIARKIQAQAAGGHAELQNILQFLESIKRTRGILDQWSHNLQYGLEDAAARIRASMEAEPE